MSRTVIITGGASGIGAGLARALARRGDTLVLADIDVTGAEALADTLSRTTQASVIGAELDVRDAAAVRQLVDDTVARTGRLDVMFNNAGIGVGGESLELDVAHWDRVIDVNLRGVVHGVTAALPHMVRQGDGHIVNTASLAGLVPAPFLAPYSATKHAVVGMTLSLRVEFADRGVRFSALCPGFTDTPILDKEMPDDLPPVTIRQPVREMAQALPGGVYELDKLVVDILRGLDHNDPLIVAPATARAAWRSFRTSPAMVLRVITKQLRGQAAKAGGPPT